MHWVSSTKVTLQLHTQAFLLLSLDDVVDDDDGDETLPCSAIVGDHFKIKVPNKIGPLFLARIFAGKGGGINKLTVYHGWTRTRMFQVEVSVAYVDLL